VASRDLDDIVAKVEAGERLGADDGVRLLTTRDLLAVGRLARLACRRRHGDRVYFVVNRHINHTNVCVNGCRFCAFSRKPGEPGAFTLTLDEIEAKALASRSLNISELHIVGGLNPVLDLDYYARMLRRLRRVLPGVQIKALTAVEIDYLARREGLTVEEVLRVLQDAGLVSLPGGGAEVFSPRVRRLVCPQKISGERWLEIHAAAHRLGIRTNATMLYGHVETPAERVDHLLRLRDLQDRTGGFLAFIPLAFQPRHTALSALPGTTGCDDLKMIAVARLLLDNFAHIKAYWIGIGPGMAQLSLHFGANDMDGTVVEEKISHAAGADTPEYSTREELVRLIKEAGRGPVERDALYSAIKEY